MNGIAILTADLKVSPLWNKHIHEQCHMSKWSFSQPLIFPPIVLLTKINTFIVSHLSIVKIYRGLAASLPPCNLVPN